MTRASKTPYSDVLAAMRAAAHAGVRVIQEGAARRGSLTWEAKGPADYLTEIDRNAELRIRDSLTTSIPGAAVLGEETWHDGPSMMASAGLTFIVDPLDGTTNFLHGVPEYAVSIGALDNGVPVAALIQHAVRDETYTATRHGGAFFNDELITVSTITDPARALIATGFPFNNNADIHRYAAQFSAVAPATAGIRRAGSAALDLAGLAAGRFEAFWELSLQPWDIAAGVLLIRESGGLVTDFDGHDARIQPGGGSLVAGNPAMHAWLLDLLQRADALVRIIDPEAGGDS